MPWVQGLVDTPFGEAYGGPMSDIPADEGPEPEENENPREFLADALSPVVDPDYDSRASARTGDHGAGGHDPKD
jgi:hypothetical protein